MSRFGRWLVPALVLVGTACAGVGLAVAGGFLRMKLCFGGGSECDGVQPLWESGGRMLAAAGSVVFLGAPVIAALVAWRLHVRRQRLNRVESESG